MPRRAGVRTIGNCRRARLLGIPAGATVAEAPKRIPPNMCLLRDTGNLSALLPDSTISHMMGEYTCFLALLLIYNSC